MATTKAPLLRARDALRELILVRKLPVLEELQACDFDGRNKVHAHDFLRVMQALQAPLSVEEWEPLFVRMADHQGMLSLRKLQRFADAHAPAGHTDPDARFAALPQPFRFIDKVLQRDVFEVAWEAIVRRKQDQAHEAQHFGRPCFPSCEVTALASIAATRASSDGSRAVAVTSRGEVAVVNPFTNSVLLQLPLFPHGPALVRSAPGAGRVPNPNEQPLPAAGAEGVGGIEPQFIMSNVEGTEVDQHPLVVAVACQHAHAPSGTAAGAEEQHEAHAWRGHVAVVGVVDPGAGVTSAGVDPTMRASVLVRIPLDTPARELVLSADRAHLAVVTAAGHAALYKLPVPWAPTLPEEGASSTPAVNDGAPPASIATHVGAGTAAFNDAFAASVLAADLPRTAAGEPVLDVPAMRLPPPPAVKPIAPVPLRPVLRFVQPTPAPPSVPRHTRLDAAAAAAEVDDRASSVSGSGAGGRGPKTARSGRKSARSVVSRSVAGRSGRQGTAASVRSSGTNRRSVRSGNQQRGGGGGSDPAALDDWDLLYCVLDGGDGARDGDGPRVLGSPAAGDVAATEEAAVSPPAPSPLGVLLCWTGLPLLRLYPLPYAPPCFIQSCADAAAAAQAAAALQTQEEAATRQDAPAASAAAADDKQAGKRSSSASKRGGGKPARKGAASTEPDAPPPAGAADPASAVSSAGDGGGPGAGAGLFRQWTLGSAITAVAVGEQGRVAFVGMADGCASAWDVETGVDIATFRAHNAPVTALAMQDSTRAHSAPGLPGSPRNAGLFAITGAADGRLHCYRLRSTAPTGSPSATSDDAGASGTHPRDAELVAWVEADSGGAQVQSLHCFGDVPLAVCYTSAHSPRMRLVDLAHGVVVGTVEPDRLGETRMPAPSLAAATLDVRGDLLLAGMPLVARASSRAPRNSARLHLYFVWDVLCALFPAIANASSGGVGEAALPKRLFLMASPEQRIDSAANLQTQLLAPSGTLLRPGSDSLSLLWGRQAAGPDKALSVRSGASSASRRQAPPQSADAAAAALQQGPPPLYSRGPKEARLLDLLARRATDRTWREQSLAARQQEILQQLQA